MGTSLQEQVQLSSTGMRQGGAGGVGRALCPVVISNHLSDHLWQDIKMITVLKDNKLVFHVMIPPG